MLRVGYSVILSLEAGLIGDVVVNKEGNIVCGIGYWGRVVDCGGVWVIT